jgi:hypothetical protein
MIQQEIVSEPSAKVFEISKPDKERSLFSDPYCIRGERRVGNEQTDI